MSIIKAFARGFADSWSKVVARFSWQKKLWDVFEIVVLIVVWEWMHGRLP